MFNPPYLGEILREEVIKPLDVSVTEAARRLGVSRVALSRILNADFHGAKSLNVSLWDYPGFARKFGKFATETLIGLFCQAWF